MIEFLIKHFVKNPQDYSDPDTRTAYGSMAGGVGIVLNLILSTFKISIGLMTGSIAVLGDGINNLTDTGTSLLTLIGFRLTKMKPSRKYPYGFGRTEYLVGLGISVFIIVIGTNLIQESIEKTLDPVPIDTGAKVIVILIFAIICKLWQSHFLKDIGTRIKSEALLAASSESRLDVISTGVVLLATLVQRFANINIDGPAGVAVALFITVNGILACKETLVPILGQTPDKALSKKIKRLVIRPECVYSVYQLIIHDYGANSIYATICANVDNRYSLEEISTVLDSLEAKAQKELNVNLTIRANPIDINDPLLTGTIDALIEICLDVDALINVHNIHIVHDKDQNIARYEVVKKYKANLTDDEIKSILAARLAEKIPGIKSEVSVVTMYF